MHSGRMSTVQATPVPVNSKCVNYISSRSSDAVLDARPWSRGASKPNFMALASKVQALASKVQALTSKVEALASKVQALTSKIEALTSKVQALALKIEALALRAALTIF